MASSGGYGFLCKLGDLVATKRAGKQFITVESHEVVLRPVPWLPPPPPDPQLHLMGPVPEPPILLVAALSSTGRVLCFPLSEMKSLSGGGRGVKIMIFDGRETLVDMGILTHTLEIQGIEKGGDLLQDTLSGRKLKDFVGHRASKGRLTSLKGKAAGLKAW